MSAPNYRGPREYPILWQHQPAAQADRWAQVLGEILPPAVVGGPLPAEQQPRAVIVLPGASASIERPAVVELVDALRTWLDRTAWSARLPAAPVAVCSSTYNPRPGAPVLRCERPEGHGGEHRWGSAAPEGPVRW